MDLYSSERKLLKRKNRKAKKMSHPSHESSTTYPQYHSSASRASPDIQIVLYQFPLLISLPLKEQKEKPNHPL